jgi:TM2 domain-containing membrane protein YozV
MEAQKVDMFMMSHSKFFEDYQSNGLRDQLLASDDSKWARISTIQLKDPVLLLIVSILVGHFGIDRMLIGDTGLGVIKLITCGGLGFWTIIDWFFIMKATREKNIEKVRQYLY